MFRRYLTEKLNILSPKAKSVILKTFKRKKQVDNTNTLKKNKKNKEKKTPTSK